MTEVYEVRKCPGSGALSQCGYRVFDRCRTCGTTDLAVTRRHRLPSHTAVSDGQTWRPTVPHTGAAPMSDQGWPDGMEMIRQAREALGMFAGAMPVTPKAAWKETLDRARLLAQGQCSTCLERDATRPWSRVAGSETDWRSLALRLMAELSWCVGFVEQTGQCVPDATRVALDDAVATLTAGGQENGLTNEPEHD